MGTSDDPLLGQVLDGRYRLVERLGEGGTGTVYAAEQLASRRRAAVKVLRRELWTHRRATDRFLREALTTAAIEHPHVVHVLDSGVTSHGLAYYAMELLQGETLTTTLQREGRMPWSRVREISLQLCDALAAAHARGVVHRDLKPDNCLRAERDGRRDYITLFDFGIAKLPGPAPITAVGEVLGTALYMAPEQAMGLPVDHRADVYAVGVIVYQLLTGELPFAASSREQTLAALLGEEAPPMRLRAPAIAFAPEVEALVARALRKSPAQRFPDIASLARAIRAVGPGAAPRQSRVRHDLPTGPMPAASAAASRSAITTCTPLSRGPARLLALAGLLALAFALLWLAVS